MICYIYRNSTKLGWQARARCCNVLASVQGWRRRTTLNCETTTSASSLDTGFRSSHVTVLKWYSCPSTLQQVHTNVPRYQKIWHLIPLLPCQQLQSFNASARLMVTIWLQFSQRMNPNHVRPCVVVFQAAQFLNHCLQPQSVHQLNPNFWQIRQA